MNKYNIYGQPIESIIPDIQIGDVVEYTDAISSQVGKRKETIHVTLQGIWDGQQVNFDDKDHTIVKAKQWLKLASKCQKCNREF